jgi:Peptidase family M23
VLEIAATGGAVLLLQLMLPLALIAWVAWRPLHSWAGIAIQIASIALYVLAIAIIGLWTFLPWWTPYGLGFALMVAIAPTFRAKQRPWFPGSLPEWIGSAVFTLLGCSAAVLAGAGLAGRIAPTSDIVALGIPLQPGRYLVANGGNSVLLNAHLKTGDDNNSRFRTWRGQSRGVDLIGITSMGFHARGLQPAAPRAYVIHSAGVIAPCSGTVRSIVDGLPDNAVPLVDREHMAGNHIVLACGGIEIVLGHLLIGSILVAPNAGVKMGDLIAAVGNSGNSDEPHLHIHAQTQGTAAEPFSGHPLHMFIGGRYLVRNQRIHR